MRKIISGTEEPHNDIPVVVRLSNDDAEIIANKANKMKLTNASFVKMVLFNISGPITLFNKLSANKKKSCSKNNKTAPPIQFKLTPDEYEIVKAQADSMTLPLSTYIRMVSLNADVQINFSNN